MRSGRLLLVVIIATTQIGYSQIQWKPFFTLAPSEGTDFVVDTAAIVPGGGVPVLNITNAGKIILTSAGGPQFQAFEVSSDGRTYAPANTPLRGPDGGFVYLPDGRTRFLSEEFDPTRTPQRHKSRVVSWISPEGVNWTRESGVRYQPGLEDDSISSVVSVIQVRDSIWRMYFVGDWYRTNGIRTAISSDWGITWQPESRNNILRRGDVDPHPVYLANGRVRVYMRTGFNSPDPSQRGIGYCDSDDGLKFDTLQTRLVVPDTALPRLLKLDPAVIRFPNGSVACYIGAAPGPGSPAQENPKLIVAWQRTPTKVGKPGSVPSAFQLFQNYPNPFNPVTTIRFEVGGRGFVSMKVFDVLGREVATVMSQLLDSGPHTVVFDGSPYPSGVYFYRVQVKNSTLQKAMVLLR